MPISLRFLESRKTFEIGKIGKSAFGPGQAFGNYLTK